MKKITIHILAAAFFAAAVCGQTQEYEKIAQTGFQFLSVSSDAQASALANATTSLEMKSSALFYNPATMATMQQSIDIAFSLNQWIAEINHNNFSAAFRPAGGRFGVVGVSVQTVDYGDLLGTIVAANEQGFLETGAFSPNSGAIGLGYAKALNNHFSVGGQVKYAHQQLGENIIPADTLTTTIKNELTPYAFDFGTLYKTGFKSLQFGMSVRNFSKEVKFAQESFQLPLVFSLGVSMDLLDFFELGGPQQSAVLSIDATHFRAHREQILVGLNYTLLDLLALRLGYVGGNDEDNFTFGFGVSYIGVVFDYAYTPFGVFDSVQRISARFSL